MRETKRDERHRASELSFGGILTETAGLTLGLEQAENVVNLDCWWESIALAMWTLKFLVAVVQNWPISRPEILRPTIPPLA